MKRVGAFRQSGQSLIQLMMVVAILSMLSMLVARLFKRATMNWYVGKAATQLAFNAHAARRYLGTNLREAAVSSVSISRVAASQPALSQVSWVDASGLSLMVYQSGRKLYAAGWSGTPVPVSPSVIVPSGLERFHVFYPDPKNPTRLHFNVTMSEHLFPRNLSPIRYTTGGDLELKNP